MRNISGKVVEKVKTHNFVFKLINEPDAAINYRLIACHLTLRQLMSYIYMEHLFLVFLDHTQRRSTVGRTPLDE